MTSETGAVVGIARQEPDLTVPARVRQIAAGSATESTVQGPAAGRAARPPYRMIVWAVLRIVVFTTALVALYYLLPLDRSSTGTAVTILVIGLAGFIGLVAFHVRSIIRSPFPGVRAIEALAISVPLFLLLFAGTDSSWPRCRPATSAGG